ncbi:MAG TPA: alpha/beta fold hydrolase [Gammaproteobacteria bacterium]|nr:alpha/beta fold hydrolase [Gammaproteobacteria bacterium]
MIATLTEHEIMKLIQGPAGKLELAVSAAEPNAKAWGVVCHPHPLFGGTMHNKVVTTLVKTFQSQGVNTIRFQFRGVGQSQGEFDHGRGELDDLYAVLNWLQHEYGQHPLWLAGFSFGAYIAAQAAAEWPTKKLVTVAPPVENFAMHLIPPILCDWLLLQGEKDEVVSPEAVFAFAESRQPAPVVVRFPDATHFFHGQLNALRAAIVQWLGG